MNDAPRSGLQAAARGWAALFLALAGTAPLFGADEIAIEMEGGRVTLVATDARLADVLAEWSRVSGTRFVGAEALGGRSITLHLEDAPEAEAIRFLLRSAVGYVAAPRRPGGPGASRYDRITIMAARAASAASTRTTNTRRGATVVSPAPRGPGGASPEAPALVSMEELQRLIDAAADPTGAAPDAAPPDVPVVVTPFPGIGAVPSPAPLPEPWRREPPRQRE